MRWMMVLLLMSSFSCMALAPLTPVAEPILTVTGPLAVTNSGQAAQFDRAALAALPQHEFSTETPWTEGVHHFKGVLLEDLLQRLGASGQHIKAIALNDYHTEFNRNLPEFSQLLLATHFDGKPMRVRDKGPLWLMLPLSELNELQNKRYHELLIWQLASLDVQP